MKEMFSNFKESISGFSLSIIDIPSLSSCLAKTEIIPEHFFALLFFLISGKLYIHQV